MSNNESQFAKNLKSLRKSLGLTQTELADAVYSTKSIISKLERGEYAPDMDKLIMFSHYFRIPIEMLTNADLSDYEPKYEELSITDIKRMCESVFPIISSEEALEDPHFKEACEKLKKYYDDCLSGKPAMVSLFDSSRKLFYKSMDENGTIESFANLLCIYFMMCISFGFDSFKYLYTEIYLRRKSASEMFNNHCFYRTKINDIEKEMNEDRKKRKEMFKEYEEIFFDGIAVLKKKSKYVELGDYLMASSYVFDLVDNSLDQYTNVLIGAEMLANFEKQGNIYVKKLLNMFD